MKALRPGTMLPTSSRSLAWYVRRVCVHPGHALVPIASTAALVAGLGLVGLLSAFVLLEVVVLVALPCVPAFRRVLDAQIERKHADAAREVLVSQMADTHRRELERMEAIADRIRFALTPRGVAPSTNDDFLGLGRLLATYARLAVAANKGNDCLSWTNRRGLDREIEALVRARDAASEHARPFIERRLAIAQARVQRWERSAAELAALTHQLAAIAELVELMQEQCFAPMSCGSMGSALEDCFDSMRENEGTIRELTALLVDEVTVEPQIFLARLGSARAANDSGLPAA